VVPNIDGENKFNLRSISNFHNSKTSNNNDIKRNPQITRLGSELFKKGFEFVKY
jgi:hypothetical protein